MRSQLSSHLIEIDADLIRRFGYSHQDYRLYPQADYLAEAFDAHAYAAWINIRKTSRVHRSLSLYIHIPFCNTLCCHCHFNQIIANGDACIAQYIDYLLQEIKLQGKLFQDDLKINQLHFGGGTPTLLSTTQLSNIMAEIRRNFNLSSEGEFCIEIDPRQTTNAPLSTLRAIGFNRAIISVQDFDWQVQQAIHRIQTENDTISTIQTAQQVGFKTIRVELTYGLPKQNVEKFNHTLERIIASCPDQISLSGYLHIPEKFKPQQYIDAKDLPGAEIKLEMILHAISRLSSAGYIHIGMNLFARYTDQLAIAQRQGRLHYSLQGYSIHPNDDHVALGVSAIGSIGPTISQNHRDLQLYYDKLDHQIIPIMRGLELSADDLLRRSVIHALICHSVLSFESVETFFPIDFKCYFSIELEELRAYEKAGLVTLSDNEVLITPRGQLLINSICMVFDKYLRASRQRDLYSELI